MGRLLVVLLLFGCVCCQSHLALPNDAKYFWCSQLYNPYYPLNPLNISLPLINASSEFSYPQPAFQVLPAQSLFSDAVETGELLISANSSGCGVTPCASVFVDVSYQNTSISQDFVLTDIQTFFTFPLSALPKNQSSVLLCSVYSPDRSTLLHQQAVEINLFSPIEQQVYIDYASKGLLVFEKPWIPMGFYYFWENAQKKFVSLAIDEVRNAMQSTIPYGAPLPPTSQLMEYIDLASKMRTRVHFDMHEIGTLPNTASKWYVSVIGMYGNLYQNRQLIDETIAAVKDKDGILAYYIADEPDGAGFGVEPSIIKEVYERIKSQDPYHPVTLVLNCVHSAPRYVDCAGKISYCPITQSCNLSHLTITRYYHGGPIPDWTFTTSRM